ncbi:MAG: hypothetical protein ACFFDY_04355 [Candidatus Thorarchaeota archaeon]
MSSHSFGLMFDARPGGEIVPIKWDKSNFLPETSIIVLDESSESVFLWHGIKQGLVARRTALRQAESLKGHGYTVGKSIIGRDIKSIKEIDARKIGKVPEDTKMDEELQAVLDRKFTELDNYIVTFQAGAVQPPIAAKPEPKVEAKSIPEPSVSKPVTPVQVSKPVQPVTPTKSPEVGSEYEVTDSMPSIKPESKPAPAIKVSTSSLLIDARISFVFSAILEHYDDIWISKKSDGSFAVEQMDGPICQFSIKEGSKLNFTANSFSGVDPKIKTAIQKKFIELSKVLQ